MNDEDRLTEPEAHPQVIIVGGSLSGLTFALACAHREICVRVLERVQGRRLGGGTLGIDRGLLLRAVGLDGQETAQTKGFPVTTGYRHAMTWQALYDWLRNHARRHSRITISEGTAISQVAETKTTVTAITLEGERIDAPVIVGADGYRSVVRDAINPGRSTASYAGYLLWRGLVSESDLPANSWPVGNEGNAFVTKTGYRLVAYPVANQSGSLIPGQRLINFTWYDAKRNELLRELRCLSSTGQVLSSLTPDRVPLSVRIELRDLAQRIWPDPWRTAITHALDCAGVFATPVTQYVPERLCRGRLAIIGDAAHVGSPITGQGFTAGIFDAKSLAKNIARSKIDDPADVARALELFERDRMPEAQSLVKLSMAWSKAFVAGDTSTLWKGWRRNLQDKS